MYQHTLIIHSGYSKGKRMALHKLCEGINDIKKFMSLNTLLKCKFNHLTFAIHHIQTQYKDIESIAEYDGFFENIEYYSDFDLFVDSIEKDITIKPMDIAKIILSNGKYSHLELQKLVYFVYCEYLTLYGEDVFLDDFEAWRHGPVIPDIYHSFKDYGDRKIAKYKDSDIFPEIYSRLVKIPGYDDLIEAIDKTLDKYGGSTAWKLVNETHVPDGPWDTVYQNGKGQNKIIPKDLIKYHIMKNQIILDNK